MKNKVIKLPVYGIEVTLNGYGGFITSTGLKTEHNDPEDEAYNNAIDGIESLILAHACAGIDIETPEYLEGIETAVNAVNNNF